MDAKLAKRLGGTCLHCSEPMIEGSDYCAPHDAREKGNRATRQRKLRQKRAKGGVCSAGCGRKVGKKHRRDKTPIPRECSDCTKLHRKRSAEAYQRRLRNERGSCVTSDGEIPPSIKLELGRDGATRTRYVPRHGQGGPSKEETQRGHLRLIADGRRLDAVFEAHYPSSLPSIEAMPRIQRAEGRSLLASPLVRGARLRLQVAEEVDPSLRGTCGGCGRAHDGPDEE